MINQQINIYKLVVEYAEMPSLDLDYNVATYVYDREKDNAVSIEQALDTAGFSSVDFDTLIKKLFASANVSGNLTGYNIDGFYISKSNEVEFFVRLYISCNTQEYSQMCTIIPQQNELYSSSKDGIKIVE